MEEKNIASLNSEWKNFEEDFQELETVHKEYIKNTINARQLEDQCAKNVAKQKRVLARISESLKRFPADSIDDKLITLQGKVERRKHALQHIQAGLPKKSGLYLRIVLGRINVSLLNENDRYKYKEQYETFKLVVTIFSFALSFLNIFISYRASDAILHFLLVWYYCTLTIRESILVVNGSRIKGWWRLHHFITTLLAGVIIMWPDGARYQMFRTQFMLYVCYTSILQFLQCFYQRGSLYRLRSLGERYNMDITVEGFHSWMWRGLGFLLPFLAFGYCFQLYNSYRLYQISQLPDCIEWEVFVSSVIFLTLFVGNTCTTILVLRKKLDYGKFMKSLKRNSRIFKYVKHISHTE